jgi:uncharacterized YccA/Bax inhibitor family protein
MRSGNPVLTANTFRETAARTGISEAMSIQGTVNKTGLLLICVLLTATYTWSRFRASGDPAEVMPFILIGGIGGLVVALITTFKKTWAPVTSPIYALLEGLVLGGLSAIFEARYPGIAVQAVGLTFGTLAGLLLAYRSGVIRATENFKLGVAAATGGIFLIYLATFILGFFGVPMPYLHESGLIGIGFSLFVVVIAALNLVLDFDFIEKGVEYSSPKYMEWYAAFGLMVTLIWLYIEFLRLLAKLRDRR